MVDGEFSQAECQRYRNALLRICDPMATLTEAQCIARNAIRNVSEIRPVRGELENETA